MFYGSREAYQCICFPTTTQVDFDNDLQQRRQHVAGVYFFICAYSQSRFRHSPHHVFEFRIWNFEFECISSEPPSLLPAKLFYIHFSYTLYIELTYTLIMLCLTCSAAESAEKLDRTLYSRRDDITIYIFVTCRMTQYVCLQLMFTHSTSHSFAVWFRNALLKKHID